MITCIFLGLIVLVVLWFATLYVASFAFFELDKNSNGTHTQDRKRLLKRT